MPADDGFWFDDQQNIGPGGPDAAERGPKQTIARIQGRPRLLALQYSDLLAERQDLKRNITPTAKEYSERCKESEDELEHERYSTLLYSLTQRNVVFDTA